MAKTDIRNSEALKAAFKVYKISLNDGSDETTYLDIWKRDDDSHVDRVDIGKLEFDPRKYYGSYDWDYVYEKFMEWYNDKKR